MCLWQLLLDSGLSAREIASAFGVSDRTIERHLAGRAPARTRRSWYNKVKSVAVNGRSIHIVVSYTAPTRKPEGWSREYRENRKRARSKAR